MYSVVWDKQTGGLFLTDDQCHSLRGEVRPVFYEELDLLGLSEFWSYPRSDEPLLWATPGRSYFYRGELVAEAKGGCLFQRPQVDVIKKNLSLVPMDVKTMLEKNGSMIVGLVQRSLEFIVSAHNRYRDRVDATTVAFSGGKDSLVLLDLVQRALPPNDFVVVFSDTTMEISATYDAVDKAQERWSNLEFHVARATMDAKTTWQQLGPPSRIHRWCCAVHKSAPTLLLLRSLVAKPSIRALVYDGVRREESPARSNYLAISEGSKHSTQINASPLLQWNSAEVFLYLLDRRLLLNRAYRNGFVRVGCAVCPMASKWWDSLAWQVYREDVKPFVSVLRSYARSIGIVEDEIDKYVSEGGWKGRAGGRGINNGGVRVLEKWDEDSVSFLIREPKEDWLEWVKAIGYISRTGQSKGQIETKRGSFPFEVSEIGQGLEILVTGTHRADRFLLSHFRTIANKTAYCVRCRACEVECPVGALDVSGSRIRIYEDKCIHCFQCLTFCEKGCLAAKSLVTSQGGKRMKGLNRYQHFGMRREWLEGFLNDPENWWHNHSLGNRQYDAMRIWLRESEIVEDNVITELGSSLRKLGSDNHLSWAVIWANLARNSALVNWYLSNTLWDTHYSRSDLFQLLDERLSPSTRNNALVTLFGLLRDTPLGVDLGLGKVEMKGRQYMSLYKAGWSEPDPVAILYSLYRLAEHLGRYDFSLSELYEGATDGPYVLYGVSRDTLVRMLRGISSRWESWLSAELVRDLDNIYLNQSKSSLDVLALADSP